MDLWNEILNDGLGLKESVLDAKALADQGQSAFPQTSVCYILLTCSIACHVGINAAGNGISVITEHQ